MAYADHLISENNLMAFIWISIIMHGTCRSELEPLKYCYVISAINVTSLCDLKRCSKNE